MLKTHLVPALAALSGFALLTACGPVPKETWKNPERRWTANQTTQPVHDPHAHVPVTEKQPISGEVHPPVPTPAAH